MKTIIIINKKQMILSAYKDRCFIFSTSCEKYKKEVDDNAELLVVTPLGANPSTVVNLKDTEVYVTDDLDTDVELRQQALHEGFIADVFACEVV